MIGIIAPSYMLTCQLRAESRLLPNEVVQGIRYPCLASIKIRRTAICVELRPTTSVDEQSLREGEQKCRASVSDGTGTPRVS